MNTLGDMAQFIGEKIGKTDADSLNRIRGFIRRRYQMIYDHALWKESQIIVAIPPLEAAQDTVILPHFIERPVAVRINNSTANITELTRLFKTDPTIFERIGSPTQWSEIAPSATKRLPGGRQITAYSTDAGDTSQIVNIFGEFQGAEYRETITLTGGTPVNSAYSYDVCLTLSKQATRGKVVITSAGASLIELSPTERERKHPRIWLHAAPQDAGTLILVLGKRHIDPLANDADTVLVRTIVNALLAYAQGDALEWLRQYGKAQVKFKEGADLVGEAKKAEKSQGGQMQQIIPEPYGGWDGRVSASGAWPKE